MVRTCPRLDYVMQENDIRALGSWRLPRLSRLQPPEQVESLDSQLSGKCSLPSVTLLHWVLLRYPLSAVLFPVSSLVTTLRSNHLSWTLPLPTFSFYRLQHHLAPSRPRESLSGLFISKFFNYYHRFNHPFPTYFIRYLETPSFPLSTHTTPTASHSQPHQPGLNTDGILPLVRQRRDQLLDSPQAANMPKIQPAQDQSLLGSVFSNLIRARNCVTRQTAAVVNTACQYVTSPEYRKRTHDSVRRFHNERPLLTVRFCLPFPEQTPMSLRGQTASS